MKIAALVLTLAVLLLPARGETITAGNLAVSLDIPASWTIQENPQKPQEYTAISPDRKHLVVLNVSPPLSEDTLPKSEEEVRRIFLEAFKAQGATIAPGTVTPLAGLDFYEYSITVPQARLLTFVGVAGQQAIMLQLADASRSGQKPGDDPVLKAIAASLKVAPKQP
ncbi:MAG: hypothetical protein AAGK14_01340 [Verrucomicrobiota bacterium]